MTGSVRRDKKTNKWMYVIEIGSKGNRKRKVKKKFKNQREAKNAMALALAELQKENINNVAQNDITLNEYLDYWLKTYARSNTAPSTYQGYEKIIRVHLKPALGEIKLSELTTRDVQDYYTEKLELNALVDEDVKVLSAQTVKHHHRLLTKALNDAIDWDFLVKNVAVKAKSPKPDRFKITTYNIDELNKLFEVAKASKVHYPIIFTATGNLCSCHCCLFRECAFAKNNQLRNQVIKWTENNTAKHPEKRSRKTKEKLSPSDLRDWMGMNRPTYKRGLGGAVKQNKGGKHE